MMSNKTVIIYASVDGQTKKICDKIRNILLSENHAVEMISVNEGGIDFRHFGKIILASSIRYGKHHPKMIQLISENSEKLNEKKSIFISVNLVARKPNKNSKDTNPYVAKFLTNSTWKPAIVGIFAGMLDYEKYSFTDALMIRLIMLLTKGPIYPKGPVEYTDWDRVHTFGKEISLL
ncbi:menaquinone-dependent protoporphyrinogen IX dehydrogenase [Rhodonellum sp.]|uniref:menaquinone-dependent protoporphyrinogen IX dehydrogenase n=1 Tax=Rhodonellum sp. TaxID=2231180 RepID=UPI0027217640|nr:menaquinone-dependent protoporphyrinogen IX dehydrogenase [Rhodonellum sp.]MDO9554270.1 menaquinone-dependent protoporphyrinogen IX dehydrogenase [Rhodonellum sp.]